MALFTSIAPLIISDIDEICNPAESSIPKFEVVDKDGFFQVSLDVPGMKDSDLKVSIEKQSVTVSGTTSKTNDKSGGKFISCWKKSFALNPKASQFENATANLSDGVLTIKVPKKPSTGPSTITVHDDESSRLEAEKFASDKSYRSKTMDLPGVRISDLKVSLLEDGVVDVSGTRKTTTGHGDTKLCYATKVLFDPKTTDMTQFKAVLNNGVLTMYAPTKPKPEPKQILVETHPVVLEDADAAKKQFVQELDLPGIKSSDVSLKVSDEGILTIHAVRASNKATIAKSFRVDTDVVDVSQLRASLVDGVLTMAAPKLQSEVPINVSISTTNAAESSTPMAVSDVGTQSVASA